MFHDPSIVFQSHPQIVTLSPSHLELSSVFSRDIILGDRVPQIDPLKIFGDPPISGIIEVQKLFNPFSPPHCRVFTPRQIQQISQTLSELILVQFCQFTWVTVASLFDHPEWIRRLSVSGSLRGEVNTISYEARFWITPLSFSQSNHFWQGFSCFNITQVTVAGLFDHSEWIRRLSVSGSLRGEVNTISYEARFWISPFIFSQLALQKQRIHAIILVLIPCLFTTHYGINSKQYRVETSLEQLLLISFPLTDNFTTI